MTSRGQPVARRWGGYEISPMHSGLSCEMASNTWLDRCAQRSDEGQALSFELFQGSNQWLLSFSPVMDRYY